VSLQYVDAHFVVVARFDLQVCIAVSYSTDGTICGYRNGVRYCEAKGKTLMVGPPLNASLGLLAVGACCLLCARELCSASVCCCVCLPGLACAVPPALRQSVSPLATTAL
jgi:hypothetical protein